MIEIFMFLYFKCYCIQTLKGTTLMHTETVERQCDDAIHFFFCYFTIHNFFVSYEKLCKLRTDAC